MLRLWTLRGWIVAAGFVGLVGPVAADAQLVRCPRATDAARIASALDRIRESVDPCGESAELGAVLDTLEHCARASYQICTDLESGRNLFELPTGSEAERQPRTITWNPELRSELEDTCEGDSAIPVVRDPVASLLHEIVHAAHDCHGLNPGEFEFEAVRIENIYRRAAGLCQRSRYGEDPLPSAMLKTCGVGYCACAIPADVPAEAREVRQRRRSPGNARPVADSATRTIDSKRTR